MMFSGETTEIQAIEQQNNFHFKLLKHHHYYVINFSIDNFSIEKQSYYSSGIKSKDGDFVIDPGKTGNVKLSYAGATIVYSNKKKRYANTLKITGPTTARLKIMVRTTLVSLMMIDVNLF